MNFAQHQGLGIAFTSFGNNPVRFVASLPEDLSIGVGSIGVTGPCRALRMNRCFERSIARSKDRKVA